MTNVTEKTDSDISPWRRRQLESPGSWVVIEKATGKAVTELFSRSLVDKLNAAKYEAVPALLYLESLNEPNSPNRH